MPVPMKDVPLKNVYAFERYLADTGISRLRQPQGDDLAPPSPFSRVLSQRQLAHRLRMLEFAMRRGKSDAR